MTYKDELEKAAVDYATYEDKFTAGQFHISNEEKVAFIAGQKWRKKQFRKVIDTLMFYANTEVNYTKIKPCQLNCYNDNTSIVEADGGRLAKQILREIGELK